MGPESRESLRSLGRVSALGIEFAAAVAIFLVLGGWADKKLGTGPWLAMVGIILGSALGFKAVYSAAKVMQRQAEAEDRPPDDS